MTQFIIINEEDFVMPFIKEISYINRHLYNLHESNLEVLLEQIGSCGLFYKSGLSFTYGCTLEKTNSNTLSLSVFTGSIFEMNTFIKNAITFLSQKYKNHEIWLSINYEREIDYIMKLACLKDVSIISKSVYNNTEHYKKQKLSGIDYSFLIFKI